MNISGELAKTLLELAPDATVIVDAAGTIVFANAQIEQTFGYSPRELEGLDVEALLPQRYRDGHIGHRNGFATQPRPRAMGAGLALLGLHKNGREFPLEISLSPVHDGGETLVVAAVRDATNRRDTERQLVEANRAKSRLLAAASHDLRQPLQTLNLLNRAAQRHIGGNAALRNVIERQQLALDSMAALLASALDVSKLDSGAVPVEIAATPLDTIFTRLRSDFEPQAADKGLQLVVEPTREGGLTDPELLQRLLGNLLANAIRYTHHGNVTLRCERAGDEVAIEVRDTGIGIPATEIERVFEEFYQVDHGTQRPEGLGLGLSIVRRLAALLKAAVTVESEVGRGTTFTVSIPRAEVTAPATETVATPAPAARGRVLVVDDEPSVAHATSLLLDLEGFDVDVATCEVEALAHAQRAAPDVIVSDYHLRAGQTGLDVVNAVRASLTRTIPAIFVTGDTSKLAAAKTKIEKCTLLSKPMRADDLIIAIRSQLTSTP
jgi:PAS domain S-box-containing protein